VDGTGNILQIQGIAPAAGVTLGGP